MRETYLTRKRKARKAHWRMRNRKSCAPHGIVPRNFSQRRFPAVLSYREQQIKDADDRMRYHALRLNKR